MLVAYGHGAILISNKIIWLSFSDEWNILQTQATLESDRISWKCAANFNRITSTSLVKNKNYKSELLQNA